MFVKMLTDPKDKATQATPPCTSAISLAVCLKLLAKTKKQKNEQNLKQPKAT